MDDMEEYCLRYRGPVYSEALIPDDLSRYPFVIACQKQGVAIVAVNPRLGYFLYENGMKSEFGNLEKMIDDTPTIPLGSWEWAGDLLQKEIKDQERKRTKEFRSSRDYVNEMGSVFVSNKSSFEERYEALQVIKEWRSLHLHPLAAFQSTLRKYVQKIDSNGIVSQGLKGIPTIVDDLWNQQPQIDLLGMSDTGVVTAVVSDIDKVHELEKKYDRLRSPHVLKEKRDYSSEPKDSGYRGIHFVYENKDSANADYDGLLIEVQLYTRLQYLCLNAAHAVYFFLRDSLRLDDVRHAWFDYFQAVSAVCAYDEGCVQHSKFQGFTQKQLIERVRLFSLSSGATFTLNEIQRLEKTKTNQKLADAAYWIIETTSSKRLANTRIYPFLASQRDSADLAYRQLEQSKVCCDGDSKVVLVSADSLEDIEKAYPSFFLDIDDFRKELYRIVP